MQAMADHIDQLDLALDQLAVRDRNFDRFALMLIDNVVELVLHQHAKDSAAQSDMWGRIGVQNFDSKLLQRALGPHFDAKVKFAKTTGLLSAELGESISYLHGFRNSAYHRGLRHEGILHSLAIFYFKSACALLRSYSPPSWSFSSLDSYSHRAIKYIGRPNVGSPSQSFQAAWARLLDVAESFGSDLAGDLHADLVSTVDAANDNLDFLANNGSLQGRDAAVIHCQLWATADSDEVRSFAARHSVGLDKPMQLMDWLAANYPYQYRKDPVPSWRTRISAVAREENAARALKQYCDFMQQTERFRQDLEEDAAGLDAHIEMMVDEFRER